MIYSGSANGSLMLLGEHAVLYGMRALCCAIDRRIRVNLSPRKDTEIHLHSATLGSYKMTLESFVIQEPFKFVLTVIERFRHQISSGFDLTIHAEFSATMGLGSSSAVTVATVGVLTQWLGLSISSLELFSIAKEVITRVQGVGSGADVAAAVFGGIVAYRMDPLTIQPLAILSDIVLVYSGAKVPTSTVIEYVRQKRDANPEDYQRLFHEIDACVEKAIVALETQNWKELGELMNQHQRLQEALGVSTPVLNELIHDLREQPEILGAKISGSGLGDCVLGLGRIAENVFPQNRKQREMGVQQIPVKISNVGYRIENA